MSSLEKVPRILRNKKLNSQSKASSLHHTLSTHKIFPSSIFQVKEKGTRSIPIYLFYKRQKFIIKAHKGMPFSRLKQLLYGEIVRFEYQRSNSSEAVIRAISKILGFSTCNNNLKLDYMICVGQGEVLQSLLLQCFFTAKKSNRISSYEIYNCLAIGGFSKVYLARSREDGRFYAIKFIKKKENTGIFNESSVNNQMKICNGLNHPFIVNMREGFQTQNFHCMVFEYCPGGELFFLLKRIKRMKENEARFYFIQILLGIKCLHENLIVYRDLKPENILIDYKGNVKIVDFGLSKKLESQRQKTFSFCGSTQYMAPEMILRMGHSFAIDYYSLGALLYQLVVGLPPYYSKDQQVLKQSIIRDQLAFPANVELSEQIRDLLSRLLHKDSKIRLGSYIGIKQIMIHPWIKKIKTEEILQKTIECPFPTDLQSYNFDVNELGDDEEQFTKVIHQDINNSKLKNKFKIFVEIPKNSQTEDREIIKSIIETIKLKERHSCRNFDEKQNIPTRSILEHHKKINRQKNLNSYTQKIKLHVTPKHGDEKKWKSIDSQSQGFNKIMENNEKMGLQEKLMPYLTKNMGVKKDLLKRVSKKKIPKSNILKMRVQGNGVIEEGHFQ